MAKKVSAVVKEYRKNRRRIQRAIMDLTKRGYEVPENILPSIPKRVTEGSVRRLQKITKNVLYKKSIVIDYETGEIIPGLKAKEIEAAVKRERRKAERELRKAEPVVVEPYSKELPQYADIIISGFKYTIESHFPNSAGPIIIRWLNNLITRYDKNDVADMLESAANKGIKIDYKIAYSSELLLNKLAEFMNLMEGIPEGRKLEIIESLELEEDWELPV